MGILRVAVGVAVVGIALYFAKPWFNGPMCESDVRMDGKVVIVTGANTGIGLETVVDLVSRGARVYMACRSIERGEKAAVVVQTRTGAPAENSPVLKLDLSSLKSVRQFVQEFKKRETRLDVLINNAGLGQTTRTETEDGFETHFGVNHLGHFLLTNLLLDTLKASAPSRVVTVSSIMYMWGQQIRFDDLQLRDSFECMHAYGQSKLANILFTSELGRRLEGTGVTTYSLHPGSIRTELTRDLESRFGALFRLFQSAVSYFMKDPLHGAQTQICCAVDPKLGQETGKFYRDCAEEGLWSFTEAGDEEVARNLWDISAKLVKLPVDSHTQT